MRRHYPGSREEVGEKGKIKDSRQNIIMPTLKHMQDGWAAERELGLRPEDSYGDEHFADDPEFIRERRIREEQLRRYLDFENLCYFK